MRPARASLCAGRGQTAAMIAMVVALPGVGVACEAGEPADTPAPEARSGPEERGSGTLAVPAIEPSQANRPADGLGLRAALEGAAEAAAEAETGATDCERAYNGLVAMADGLHQRMGDPGSRPETPDREGFLVACGRMPPVAQRCMVLSYSMRHVEECRRAREALPDDMREELARAARGERAP